VAQLGYGSIESGERERKHPFLDELTHDAR
jgi:hypothetical protein